MVWSDGTEATLNLQVEPVPGTVCADENTGVFHLRFDATVVGSTEDGSWDGPTAGTVDMVPDATNTVGVLSSVGSLSRSEVLAAFPGADESYPGLESAYLDFSLTGRFALDSGQRLEREGQLSLVTGPVTLLEGQVPAAVETEP